MEHTRIHRDPDIMVGKPCIKDTRITVEHILREISGDATIACVAESYLLNPEDVTAALAYAADRLREVARKDAGLDGPPLDELDGWIDTPLSPV